MSRSQRDGDPFTVLLLLIAGITVGLFFFVRAALKKGRNIELAVSSIILGTHCFVCYLSHVTEPMFYQIPLFIYAVYWTILLLLPSSMTKNITFENSRRDDVSWWWSLNGWEFEEEVAKVFRDNGYEVEVTRKVNDGGIDLVMYRNGKKTIVQCKHYRNEVPVQPLRELNGLKEDFEADELILVASSGITRAGEEFVSNKPYFTVLTLEDIMRMGSFNKSRLSRFLD